MTRKHAIKNLALILLYGICDSKIFNWDYIVIVCILQNHFVQKFLFKGTVQWDFFGWKCITGNRKSSFIIFPSHKIIVQNIQSYRKLWNMWWCPATRCETQLAPLMFRVDRLYSPPHSFTCLICGESYICWVQGNNSWECIVAVTLSCDTLTLTTLSSFSLTTSSPFFFLPWERLGCTFLGCTMPVFWLGSLAVWRGFPTLPWASLAASHEVQPPSCPSQ